MQGKEGHRGFFALLLQDNCRISTPIYLFYFLQSGSYQPGNIGYLPMTTSPADSFRQVFTKTNFHTNKCKDTFLISDLLKVDMISFISKEFHFE